ncbi:hypothetical protein BJF90_37455 [Pseudonocardia sp. CNS-004]|nr:hypothetical protein BJF90_37455 [Pseudonocardia sp. CNS-004]
MTSDDRRSVENSFWAADSRYLFYMQDTDGDENHHLHRVDSTRLGEAGVDLTPIRGAGVQDQLSADRPGTVLVQLNARRPDVADLHDLDLDTAPARTY